MTKRMNWNELSSPQLTLCVPSAGAGYSRPRFDWSGAVIRARGEDGKEFLSADRRPAPHSCSGQGLMEEFFDSDQGGYARAGRGEGFLKMGVGVLQKLDDAPYNQKVDYPLLQPVERQEAFFAHSAEMEEYQRDFQGYSYRLQRRITVEQNAVRMDCRLENTGRLPLSFSVYNHNFLPQGAELVLRGSFSGPGRSDFARPVSPGLAKLQPPCEPAGTALEGCRGQEGWFCLCDPQRAAAVRAEVRAPVSRGYLWATRDTVCPELFSDFSLLPGQKGSWKRIYYFQQNTCPQGCPDCPLAGSRG